MWISGFVLSLLMVFAAIQHMQQRRLDRKVAEIRARGEPMTWEDLAAYQPPVPDADNAAPILEQAFAKMVSLEHVAGVKENFLPIVGVAPDPSPGEPMPDEMRQMSELYLTANREALDLLRQAAQKPACRWSHVPSVDKPYPECFDQLRPAFRLISLDIYVLAEKGENDVASRELRSSLALAALMPAGCAKDSYWFNYACLSLVLRQVESILNFRGRSSEDLMAIRSSLPKETALEENVRQSALIAERGFMFSAIQESSTDAEDFLVILTGGEHHYGRPTDIQEMFERVVLNLCFNLYFAVAYRRDVYHWLLYYDEFIAASRLQDMDRLKAVDALQARITKEFTFLNIITRATHFRTIFSCQKHSLLIAQLRCVQTLLAVERYRAERGDLPASLADLVPTYLPAVPIDPFDGRELRYRIIRGETIKLNILKRNEKDDNYPYETELAEVPGRGYMVYSVGQNRVDDGGTPLRPSGVGKTDTDITFMVNR